MLCIAPSVNHLCSEGVQIWLILRNIIANTGCKRLSVREALQFIAIMKRQFFSKRSGLIACAGLALGLLVLSGCGRDDTDEITVYRVTRESDEALRDAKRQDAERARREGEQGEMASATAAPVSPPPSQESLNPSTSMEVLPGMEDASGTIGDPSWEVPAHWTELPPTPIRKGNFVVEDEEGRRAEITVTAFPGDVGGLVANVNRWRQQLGLPPQSPEEIEATVEPLALHGEEATLVGMEADDHGTAPNATLAVFGAIIPVGENTWFVKMTGDRQLVRAERDILRQFVGTFRF